MKGLLVILCFAVLFNLSWSTRRDKTNICYQKSKSIGGNASNKCAGFKRCCSAQCLREGRKVVVNNCKGRFFDIEEKDCMCGHRTSGRRESTGYRDVTDVCYGKAQKSMGTVSSKCETFKKCCDYQCRRDERAVLTKTCEGRFFDIEEKDCTCGPPKHDKQSSVSDVTTTCDRIYGNTIGSDTSKCRAFKRCCGMECRGRGKQVTRNVCDVDGFEGSPVRECLCEGRTAGGSGHGHGSSLRDISRHCRREVERDGTPSRERCDEFRSCCRSKCRNEDMSFRETRCDRWNFDRAACDCRS